MCDVLDLDHIRRSRRLFGIFLARYGLEHFLECSPGGIPRLDQERMDQTLALAADWIERRTERRSGDATLELMARDLKRAVLVRLAERMVQAGH